MRVDYAGRTSCGCPYPELEHCMQRGLECESSRNHLVGVCR